MTRQIDFTMAELRALNHCLNWAGNAEAWLAEQTDIRGSTARAIRSACSKIALEAP